MRKRPAKAKAIDPEGQRLIALTLKGNEPIFAPKGHASLASAAGGGKSTGGATPWLFSLAASEPHKAILVFDCKGAELAHQTAAMLAAMGRKVAVIDDFGMFPDLAEYRINLNAFGAAVSAYRRDPRDAIFAQETISKTLIPDPVGGPDKNKHFRDVPQEIDEFSIGAMLARNPDLATPGASAALLSDPELLKSVAETAAEEGDPALKSQAHSVLETMTQENWGMHSSEARRSLRLFAPGTRLHEAGRGATLTHEDLIREGYIVFLTGPMAYMNRLGSYFALHIMSFCDALYSGAGHLRIIADEFTNIPLKSLVESLTTLRAFGCEVFLIYQSRSEVIRRFGKLECETLEENCIVKQWFGFSSFAEAERISRAMGEQHAVAEGLSGEHGSLKSQSSLSLIKQRWMSAAELMSMPRYHQLIHIKGLGFILARTITQAEITPFCHLIAPYPQEGGRRLPPDPKVTLVTPGGY